MKEGNETVITRFFLLSFIIHVNHFSQDYNYKNKNRNEIITEPGFTLIIINIQTRIRKRVSSISLRNALPINFAFKNMIFKYFNTCMLLE